MNPRYSVALALSASLFLGCATSSQQGQTPASASPAAAASSVKVAYDTGTIKKGDKGHCVVCVVKEGSKEEEAVVETLDYKGKTYVFCNESEKAEFISDPSKYAAK
jgi:YHS domain-containing protein